MKQKKVFWLLFIVFCLVITPFTIAWLFQQGSPALMNYQFWYAIFHDPFYQVTAIDFGCVALFMFWWMIQDSKKRAQGFLPWVWLPVWLVSPSFGLFGYLLTRKEIPA